MIAGARIRQQWIRRRPAILLICALAFAFAACEKTKSPEEVAPLDRVGSSPSGTSLAILHKTFTVRTTVAFPFEIPEHAPIPHLRGNFKSFVTKVGIHSDEHSADVDFLVLNEDQYANFAAGTPGDSLFSLDASHDQAVDVNLPPSFNQGAKYYLVFRNTPGGDTRKTVQADLTADF
jgi:hypothetical protein